MKVNTASFLFFNPSLNYSCSIYPSEELIWKVLHAYVLSERVALETWSNQNSTEDRKTSWGRSNRVCEIKAPLIFSARIYSVSWTPDCVAKIRYLTLTRAMSTLVCTCEKDEEVLHTRWWRDPPVASKSDRAQRHFVRRVSLCAINTMEQRLETRSVSRESF